MAFSTPMESTLQMGFTEKQRLELGGLSSEFNILVLISTFTAALIISFLALAQNIIGDAKNRPYQFGMFFSFIAMGFHLFATLVAARAGMICFRLSKSLDIHPSMVDHNTSDSQCVQEHPNTPAELEPPRSSYYDKQLEMVDFQRFLVLCEQLQLMGTTLYLPSGLFLIFYMFDRMEFAIVIYALTVIAAWAVYRLGFWKVSVLWHDLNHVCLQCKAMILKVGKSK